MQDPRTFPQLVATADPSTLPAAGEGAPAPPAMTLNRVTYVTPSNSAGATANVEELAAVIVSPQPLQGLLTAAVLYTQDQLGGAPNGVEQLTSSNVPTPTGFEFDANPRGLITFSVDTQNILGTAIKVPLTGTLLNGGLVEPQLDADYAQLVAAVRYGMVRDNDGQPQFEAARFARNFIATGASLPVVDVPVSLFTPTAGHRFRLLGGEISLALALDVAGVVVVELYDGNPTTTGVLIRAFVAFAPAAAPTGDTQITFDLGQGWLSGALDQDLFALFSVGAGVATIDAGAAAINCNLMEEAVT